MAQCLVWFVRLANAPGVNGRITKASRMKDKRNQIIRTEKLAYSLSISAANPQPISQQSIKDLSSKIDDLTTLYSND